MEKFLISAIKKGQWSISSEIFERTLREKWIDAKVILSDSPTVKVRFNVTINGSFIEGHLHRTEDCVVVNGEIASCADFAVWLYKISQPKATLLIYDENFINSSEINTDTTSGQIIKSLSK